MLATLLRRLSAPNETGLLEEEEARLAFAALLVRISRTDGSYSTAEKARVDAMLQTRYGLSGGDAMRVRAEAERAEESAADTVQFTRLIKDAVPLEDRIGVVEALWKVAATDGINADEQGLMRLVANLLGVTDQDSGLARQRVLKQGL
jgi:uncharacterized tellurite resistance protein B-like protein